MVGRRDEDDVLGGESGVQQVILDRLREIGRAHVMRRSHADHLIEDCAREILIGGGRERRGSGPRNGRETQYASAETTEYQSMHVRSPRMRPHGGGARPGANMPENSAIRVVSST